MENTEGTVYQRFTTALKVADFCLFMNNNIIVFACRGVEGVPARIAEGVGKRKTPLRTTSQMSRLRTIQAINQRKAIKRKQSKSPSSTSKPKTKKQKTSPFTTMMKTLKSTFTIGRSK